MKKSVIAVVFACCIALMAALAGCSQPAQSSSSGSSSFAVDPGSEQSVSPDAKFKATSVFGTEVSADPTGVKRILVIGDDSWEGIAGHADMECMLRVDFDNKQITEVTIPRDTKVWLSDTEATKLLWVYTAYGAEELTKQASKVYGENIDFYVTIGFDQFQELVDYFGGVDVNLPYNIDYQFYTHDFPDVFIAKGEQLLDGWDAMVASRSRTGYPPQGVESADLVRQYMCRQMFNKLVELAYGDPAQTNALLETFQSGITTNLPLDAQKAWADALAEGGSIEVTQVTGPFVGTDDSDLDGDWCVTPDEDGWKALHDAVEDGASKAELEKAAMSYESPDYAEGIDPVIGTAIVVGK